MKFTGRWGDIVELGIELIDAEIGSLVSVESKYVGRYVDVPAATYDDEVAPLRLTFAVRLDVVTDVHRRNISAQLQHSQVNCSSQNKKAVRSQGDRCSNWLLT